MMYTDSNKWTWLITDSIRIEMHPIMLMSFSLKDRIVKHILRSNFEIAQEEEGETDEKI